MKKLTVQLVTWNGAKYLPFLFDSLRRQTFTDFDVIVVDNASTDTTVAIVEKELVHMMQPHEFIKKTLNTGFAGGHNQAFGLSQSEYVVLINQDVCLTPDCFEKLVAVLDKYADASAVSPRLMRWNFDASVKRKLEDGFTNSVDSLGLQVLRNRRVIERGGGATEVAVISLMGIVCSISVRVAGDKMDEAIINYIKKKHNLLIGETTAEQIKMTIGNAKAVEEEKNMQIRGRDLIRGIPMTITISGSEAREALKETTRAIVEAVRDTLEKTPPELASDISERGIVMTGGGSMLKGLDQLLAEETGLPVFVAQEPLNCVVMGAGKLLENLPLLKRIAAASSR
jgi:hypothetical protein